jgi:general secretion pathway protein H
VQRNGFTLVELMVVIALMAVAAGVVALTVGSHGSGATDTATRFASRLAAARDQAILSGRPISAWATASGYGFDQLRGGHWERLTTKPFDGADWGHGMAVSFVGADGARARVRFDSLGMADRPMALRLSQDGRTADVRVAANGDVTVE